MTYDRVRRLRDKKLAELDHIIVASLHDEISRSKRYIGILTTKLPLRKKIQLNDILFQANFKVDSDQSKSGTRS